MRGYEEFEFVLRGCMASEQVKERNFGNQVSLVVMEDVY